VNGAWKPWLEILAKENFFKVEGFLFFFFFLFCQSDVVLQDSKEISKCRRKE
jgi:hypothetical protein